MRPATAWWSPPSSASIGDRYADLAAGGHLRLSQVGTAVQLWVDADGGGDAWVALALLENTTTATFGADFLIACPAAARRGAAQRSTSRTAPGRFSTGPRRPHQHPGGRWV